MAVDYTALKQYIDSDPQYALLLEKGDHTGLAALLNEKGAAELDRPTIPADDVLGAIDPTEFSALSLEQLIAVQISLSFTRGSVSSKTLDLLETAFPKDSVTSHALDEVRKQPASVIEDAFGVGEMVTVDDLGAIYKQSDTVQDEKIVMVDGQFFMETPDGTRYPHDSEGNVLRDQPIRADEGQ